MRGTKVLGAGGESKTALVTRELARQALEFFEIDRRGLDALDRKYLLTIMDKFDGGPVGIETLSAALGEERDTLEDVYEPYLVQEGLIARTPRGRIVNRLTYEHFDRLGDWDLLEKSHTDSAVKV
jgi:Holliday junction DNA helicase RuvB